MDFTFLSKSITTSAQHLPPLAKLLDHSNFLAEEPYASVCVAAKFPYKELALIIIFERVMTPLT
jgi:hypothetical protein